MELIILGLSLVTSIVSIVCWIITLVKLFQNSEIVWGIVGIICGLVAFVMGWMKADEYGIKNVMIIWTIAIIVGVILNVVLNVAVAGSM